MIPSLTIDKVRNALSTVLDLPAEQILPDHRLVADLNVDSIGVVILSIALEEEFGDFLLLNEFVVAAEDPTQLTVSCLAEYIQQKTQQAV